jgi:phage shock protein C
MPDEPEPTEPGASADTEPAEDPGAEPTVVIEPPALPPPRRLERSRKDRVIAGVCGGLGEYFGVDAVLIRIVALVLVFAGGAGLLLYAIGWIAMPEAAVESDEAEASTPSTAAPAESTPRSAVLGLVFVGLGAFFLIDEIWGDVFSWKYIWPLALIAVGVVVLLRSRQ